MTAATVMSAPDLAEWLIEAYTYVVKTKHVTRTRVNPMLTPG